MIEITHQQQNYNNSCASACMAMLLGRTSQEVEEEFHEAYRAKGDPYLFEYAAEQGLVLEESRSTQALEPDYVYLVGVPSLNMRATMHLVVIDLRGDENVVYDPNKGRQGKWVYTGHVRERDVMPGEVRIGGYAVLAKVKKAPALGIDEE